MSLTVAIPAFNEEENIRETIETVLRSAAKVTDLDLDILVVDDGSVDDTSKIVGEAAECYKNVRLIRNPRNMGLGSSIRRAIDEAKGERFIIIPGDNDMPEDALDLMFKNASAADIVMIYFHNDECRGRTRYLISEAFRLIYTSIFNLYVMYINGPAIYPTSKLRELYLGATRFSIVAEINVKLLRQGLSFIELPSERHQGLDESSPVSLPSLLEATKIFMQLVFDVFIRERKKYSKLPIRIPFIVTALKLFHPVQSDSGIKE